MPATSKFGIVLTALKVGVSFAVIVPLIIIAFSITSVINWLKKTWGECSKRVRKPGIPERFSIMWARGATRSIDPEVADGMSRMSS